MTQYGTWVSYGGDARTWHAIALLAVALLAVVSGATFAGIRLALPVRARRPVRAGRVAMIVAWVASMAALLACVTIYIRQSVRAYDLSAPAAAPRNPITPVTLTTAAVLFVIIVIISRGSYAWRTGLASGFIGAIAAPMIFELPFDLIVMARSHPVIDPGLYRLLLFGCLFAIEITTLLLLRLSPMVRLTKATFFSFALMLGVFAVWALSGFGYPSASLPYALNVASKILAFVTALTLFLPQRPAPGQAPQQDSNQQARSASRPLASALPASTEMANHSRMTSQLARTSAPGAARPPRWLLAGAVCSALAIALMTTGCSSAGPHAGAPGGRAGAAAGVVWVCSPSHAANPCASNLAATTVTAGGALQPASWPHSAMASKFACFYVHGSDGLTGIGNTSLAVTKVDISVAVEQGAPFSQVCQLWAPSYRSATLPTVEKGVAGEQALLRSTAAVAYDSVLPAWQWFLAHTGGKPIILIGDSQGSAILIHLISARLDHQPSVLRRLLVAILVGGNLQVPPGKTAGATFTEVPLCTASTEAGCAIAFSSYPTQPPPDSMSGRPGQGASLQSGQTAKAGQQVACVNPAALNGGTGNLDPYLLTATQTPQLPIPGYERLTEPVSTPWVTYPGLYSAHCEHGDGATWLQVTSLAGTSHTRPVVNDNHLNGLAGTDTGPAWGYHGYEYALTLGNLLHDVAGEEAAWESSH